MKDPRHPHGPVCKACFEKKLACQSRRNVETRDRRTKTVQTGDNKSPENSTMECPLHPPDPTFRACSEKRDASQQPCPQPHHNPHTNGSHTKPAPTEADILDIVVRTVTLKRRMEALQTQLKVVRALRRETVTLKKQTEVLETQLKGERTLRHEKEQEFTWRKHMNDSDALSPAQTKDHSVEKPPETSTIKDPRHPPGCICRGCSTKRPDSRKLEASLHQYRQSVGKPMENIMMKVESPYHPPGLPSIVLGGNTNAIKPNHPLSPGSQVEPVIDNSTLELLPKSSKHSMMNGLRHAHGLVCRGCCKKRPPPQQAAGQTHQSPKTDHHVTRPTQPEKTLASQEASLCQPESRQSLGKEKTPETPITKGPCNPHASVCNSCSEKRLASPSQQASQCQSRRNPESGNHPPKPTPTGPICRECFRKRLPSQQATCPSHQLKTSGHHTKPGQTCIACYKTRLTSQKASLQSRQSVATRNPATKLAKPELKGPRHTHGRICRACLEKGLTCQKATRQSSRKPETPIRHTKPTNGPYHRQGAVCRVCIKKRLAPQQAACQFHQPNPSSHHTKPAQTRDIFDITVRLVTVKRRMEALTQLNIVKALRREKEQEFT